MKRAIALALLAAASIPTSRAATPPGLVSYQGVLRSASGAPLNATYDMIFRFVDAPSGGTLLLTDYHTGPNGVVVTGGLFTAQLGGGTLAPGTEANLQDVFSNHAPVYVEVQVGAETLTPRVQVLSAAFALNAGRLGTQLPGDFLDRSANAQTKQGTLTSNSGLVGNASAAGTGVDGTTLGGNGVRGTSTGTSGTTYGVYGKSSSTEGTGVAGEASAASGNAWGVYGKTASSSGVGVLGSALALGGTTEGVRGQNTSPTGKGVVGAAFSSTGATYGVYGESQSPDGTGTYGRATPTSGSTTGVGGETYSTLGTGVAGVAHASSGDAWGVYGASTSPAGYGVVSDGDSLTAGDLYATGSKFFLTEHPLAADRAIRYACLEGGEAGVYQRGTGRLEHGEAHVELPSHFPLVAAGKITVDVTPLEESSGLYVPKDTLSAQGFTVREAGGGTSDTEFSYVVFAERAGHEGAKVILPLSVSDKILTSSRLSVEQKGALRRALGVRQEAELTPAARGDLYTALQAGSFDDACRLLGGCVSAPAKTGVLSLRTAPAPSKQVAPGVQASSEAASVPRETARRGKVVPAASSVEPPAPTPWPPVSQFQLAELHPVSETVEAGDVLVLDRGHEGSLKPGSLASDPTVVGIVANVQQSIRAGEQAPVAMGGTVLCKVDADYASIAPGDLLVVSPTPGHAMRALAPAPGTILGKALESLASGKGSIRVLLMLR